MTTQTPETRSRASETRSQTPVERARNARYSRTLDEIRRQNEPTATDISFAVAIPSLVWNGTTYARGDILSISPNHPRLEAMLLLGHIVYSSSSRKPGERSF